MQRFNEGNVADDDEDEEEEILIFSKPSVPASTQSSSFKPDAIDEPLNGAEVERMLAMMRIQPAPTRSNVLIILDVNGILVWREMLKGNPAQNAKPGWRKVKNFRVWNRPGLEAFMKFCLDNFAVAIWSSTRKDNLEPIVEDILGSESMKKLLFVWNQEHCTVEQRSDEPFPLFLKDLARVWAKYPQFSEGRTLLIDDDAPKAKLNPPMTSIHPIRWTCLEESDSGLQLNGSLRRYLEKLAVESRSPAFSGVQEFVRANPLD